MKTRKTTAKRLKRTGTGKLVHAQAGRRHKLTKMTRKRKRQLRSKQEIAAVDAPRLRKQLPYR
jgi:large subunit ribosomal protein L35